MILSFKLLAVSLKPNSMSLWGIKVSKEVLEGFATNGLASTKLSLRLRLQVTYEMQKDTKVNIHWFLCHILEQTIQYNLFPTFQVRYSYLDIQIQRLSPYPERCLSPPYSVCPRPLKGVCPHIYLLFLGCPSPLQDRTVETFGTNGTLIQGVHFRHLSPPSHLTASVPVRQKATSSFASVPFRKSNHSTHTTMCEICITL